ncbi:FAD-dependent 5-carboxymethylaminomethyl-2-thiouridine(34) oxidoreductase MnmC [Comamonas sp. NoAH]|uniref:FAD-dependent 5-carboxymethylaminomethyl-2-thiouridine(34) oxidoreductase MnmC n=1 Tax=Comamonas halotolerans TaxID=3041496 RepID=UPI0024E0CBB7|nr:FAD-dependent 5-carboxymethylaminomethyl-2-thiouridine(34) oxidoreductase MnmC [Comamonas sp. NoAH]
MSAQSSEYALLHAWQGRASWHVLSTDFGHGQTFLQTWAAWKADAQRSAQLHFTAIIPSAATAIDVLSLATPPQQEQAQALSNALFGLLEGVHRLSFEQGRVLLTLWVGDVQTMLRQQRSTAHAVLLNAPFASDAHSIKALARHCERGTVLHIQAPDEDLIQALERGGFVFGNIASAPSLAHFAPRWEPRKRTAAVTPLSQAGTALVIGAGLAGAAVAHSLALRGWHVHVLAAGAQPADGASGLPAGLFCPHVSPDDSVLSRLSRNGVRMTLQRLRDVCEEGRDWGLSGVLEHCTDGGTGLPPSWADSAGAQWSHATNSAQLQAAGLADDTVACWHAQAGWVRPAELVKAQLAHPHIQFQGHAEVASLRQTAAGAWQALDTHQKVLAQAEIAILACGPATAGLLPTGVQWQLQALRGQVTWGWHTTANAAALPPFPVNGNGNLVTHIPFAQGQAWVMGSTFERDLDEMPISQADQMAAHAVNFEKLSTLLPASAAPLRPWFTPGNAHCLPTWGRVRCASHDRLPIAGPVDASKPGLWASTAMGARGLTLSVLCGELIAAQLHAEPLPLDSKLAQHLGIERLARQMRGVCAPSS